jgi:drug/metabolite transporter (DMT)-like permease
VTVAVRPAETSTDAPFIAGAIAVVAWGFGPLIVRAIPHSFETIATYRVGLAVPVMVAVAYIMGGKITWTVMKHAFVPGALFFVSMITSFASFQKTSIALATLIPAVQPALVLFIAPKLFGERSSARQNTFAAISLLGVGGVVLAAGRATGSGTSGNILAAINLVVWTAYFVQIKRVRSLGIHSWSLLAAVMTVCACFTVPFGLITSNDLGTFGGSDWGYVALMIFGPGLLGHGLMTWAQRHLALSIASLMTLGNPVISAVGAWVIYSESLRPLQIVCAAVVLGALAGMVLAARQSVAAETALSGPPE